MPAPRCVARCRAALLCCGPHSFACMPNLPNTLCPRAAPRRPPQEFVRSTTRLTEATGLVMQTASAQHSAYCELLIGEAVVGCCVLYCCVGVGVWEGRVCMCFWGG